MDDALDRLETQMGVLARRVEGASRRNTLRTQMDKAAYLIARTLVEMGPSSVNDIARSLALDGSTVTRQVATMEQRGFVSRRPHPNDGRAWVIELTGSGNEEMASVRAARRARFAEFVHGWQPHEVEEFGRLLERFNTGIAAQVTAPTEAVAAQRPAVRTDHRRSVVPTRRHH